jgi:ubiquitin-protein ligase E3 C
VLSALRPRLRCPTIFPNIYPIARSDWGRRGRQGRRPLLDDLAALDPQLHRSLGALKRYAGDAADLGLDFTVEVEALGARSVHELRPRGADVPVTDANKLLYVHLVADWHLNGRLAAASAAFAAGLHQARPAAPAAASHCIHSTRRPSSHALRSID